MKKLLLALLLLPTWAYAQTKHLHSDTLMLLAQASSLPCPGSVVLTYAGGYTVTVNCSTDGTTIPPTPTPTPTPPPPVAGLPDGYTKAGDDSSRMPITQNGTLAFGSTAAGWRFRSVKAGEFIYCNGDYFPGPYVSNPSCYFKAG